MFVTNLVEMFSADYEENITALGIGEDTQKDISLVSGHLVNNILLFLNLISRLAENRLRANCYAARFTSVMGFNILEDESIPIISVESIYEITSDLISSEVPCATKSDGNSGEELPYRDFGIVAETLGVSSLSGLESALTAALPALRRRCVALNIANNRVTDIDFSASAIGRSSLVQLQCGGNPCETVWAVTARLPTTLLSLDLSYTEDLRIPQGAFLACPQLIRLVLDGCALNSTAFASTMNEGGNGSGGGEQDLLSLCAFMGIHAATAGDSALTVACRDSIFFGLVELRELSLKENDLEGVEALRGLTVTKLQGATSVAAPVSAHLPRSRIKTEGATGGERHAVEGATGGEVHAMEGATGGEPTQPMMTMRTSLPPMGKAWLLSRAQ